MTRTTATVPRGRMATRRGGAIRTLGLAALALVTLAGVAHAQVSGAIAVYPTTSTLEVGSTRQFSAYVPISPNTITWAVNGIAGGNSSVGTITPGGLYTPPKPIPASNVFTISARSTAYPASVGSATITVTRATPWVWSVSPNPVTAGAFSISLKGANFAADSQVLINGVAVASTYVSSTKLLASASAAAAGTLKVAVRQPAPGAVTSSSVNLSVVNGVVGVTLSPTSASVQLGATQAFAATVTGSSNTGVTWTVNGVAGGSAVLGTISSAGLYTAPPVMPASSTVTVRATSVANASAFAQATVTLVSPVKVTMTPTASTVPLGQAVTFVATVTGSTNTSVTWSVNSVVGGSSTVGTISPAGVYTAPGVMPPTSTVTVGAASNAAPTVTAQASVSLTAPPPPPVSLSAGRFLEQSSFGPTPATMARVQQVGISAYLDEQFATTETQIPNPPSGNMGDLRQWQLATITTAQDQLRQRVAYALSQIVVTSGNKLIYTGEILPWMRLLSQHAFGNYRDLLHDVTVSPSMGKYLDLANSMKPGLAGGANENYPRELMQLFSIGLWRLNQDGTLMLDGAGQPISTYDQNTVRQVSLALTGWTYATAPGATPRVNNWEYFGAPMESRQSSHDTTAKSFLNCSAPAGQSVEQDTDAVIDCLMQHPNIAPFIATRLIRSLVKSNPSPAYVKRVADVFAGIGGGVRGDLKATVRAILLDAEARNDVAGATDGRLKEPLLQTAAFLRALNGAFMPTNGLAYIYDHLGQMPLTPPSVFSWFSPLYRVPNSTLFGPEFQIYSPSEATLRGNVLYAMLTQSGNGDTTIDLSPFQAYGNDMPNLVEQVNQVLLYGRMPSAMKQALVTAASPGYDAATRIATVLYLTALSGQYAVQY